MLGPSTGKDCTKNIAQGGGCIVRHTMSKPVEHPLILVTGGCRSGKSAYAQSLAERLAAQRLFVATARPDEAGMQERILAHKEQRGQGWRVYEAGDTPLTLASDLAAKARPGEVILFDCLTLWAAGCMQEDAAPADFSEQCDRLLAALSRLPGPVVIVTNEVGMGVVPQSLAGRNFRDMAGLAGQKAAAAASAVVLVVCGIPLAVKGPLP